MATTKKTSAGKAAGSRTAKATKTSKSAKPAKSVKPAKAARPARAKGARRAANAEAPVRSGTALVIVESPTKAKTIGKYLGSKYSVKATVGHIRDLPTRKLGVEIADGQFTPEYVIIKGKTATVSDIKKAAKAASHVYLATDPDREGEAIAWHVASQIGNGTPMERVLFHEITKDAIKEAIANA